MKIPRNATYAGGLEIQVYDKKTDSYEVVMDAAFGDENADMARIIAGGRPWRICKYDRPLTAIYPKRFPLYK